MLKLGSRVLGLGLREQGTWDAGLAIQSNDVFMYFFSMLKDLGTHSKLSISLATFYQE